jgi:dihydroorotate dehydrogenase
MPIDLEEKEILVLLKTAKQFTIAGVVFGNLTKDHKNPSVHPSERALWNSMAGNLSGKPTWKRSLALIKLTKKHFGSRFTVIGTGGIFSGKDAREKIKAGADLVQLITGMVYEGPQLPGQIAHELSLLIS